MTARFAFPLAPLSYLADVRPSGVDKHTHPDEVPVRLCNYTDIYYRERITNDISFMEASATRAEMDRFTLAPGDVVMTKDSETADDIGIPALVAEKLDGVLLGYHNTLMRPSTDLESRFLFWFLNSRVAAAYWQTKARGVTRVGLRTEDVAALPVPLPPLDTQRRIADMLDAETARIDTLIKKNERMVAALAQRVKSLRAALLWPRECVEAWSGDPLAAPTSSVRESTRLQYVVPTRVAGGTPTSNNESYWTDESDRGAAWFAIGDLRHGSASGEPSRRVSDEGMKAAGLSVMPAGTIAYAMYASIGKTSRLLVDGVTNQAILSLVPGDGLLSDYLLEWLVFTQPFAEARARSNTQGNLNADQVARFSIRVPSMAEQRSIARELLDAKAQVAALRAKVDRQQELLRLRRRSLITAAVTGEIEV